MFGQVLTNLGGICQSVREDLDWDAPRKDARAASLLRNKVRESYLELQSMAPTLFLRDIRILTDPDLNPKTRDTISIAGGDAWTVEMDLPQSDDDASVWNEYRNWAARIILIVDPVTGIERPYRMRDVWYDAIDDKYKATLDRPYPDPTAENLDYRILTSEMPLPDNILRIKSAWVIQSGRTTRRIKITDAAEVEHRNTVDFNAWTKVQGEPRFLSTKNKFSLQAPRYIAAENAAAEVGPFWVGPEPRGTFEYVATLVWGEHEMWVDEPGPSTQTGLADARRSAYFESGPSPVIRVAADQESTPPGDYGRIEIKLPDMAHMMGFDGAATPREHHQGLNWRIYRRRVNTLETGASVVRVEDGATFQFIAELPGDETSYYDDGSDIPDRNRPFRPVSFYHLVEVYPRPSVRGVLFCRAVVRPPELVDDTDVPQVPHNCMGVLRDLTKAKILEFLKDPSQAQVVYNTAVDKLHLLLAQSASIKDEVRVERLVAGAESVYPGDTSRVIAVDSTSS